MFDLYCGSCGALVGRMSTPNAEFVRQITAGLERFRDHDGIDWPQAQPWTN